MVVTAIILGVRAGGMGLGVFGAVGVFILVFVFQLPPGAVPGSAMLIILAVITAAATMQAAGGIDYMVMVAARLIRRRPRLVTLVAPLVSYVFVVGAGTSNIFYPLIPSYRGFIRVGHRPALHIPVHGGDGVRITSARWLRPWLRCWCWWSPKA